MDLEKNKQRLEILAAQIEELKRNGGGGGTPTESDDFTPDNITIEDGGTFPSGSTERLTKHLPLEINDTLYYFLEETGVDYLYGSLPTSGAFPTITYFRVMKGSFTVEFHQTAIETVPTEDSTNLITSGGVYTALQSAGGDLDLRPKLIRTEGLFEQTVNQDDFNDVIVKHLPYKESETGDEYQFLHDNGSNYIYISTFDTPTANNGSYRYSYNSINKSTRVITNISPGNGFTVVNSRNILGIFFNGYYTGGNNTNAISDFPSDLNYALTPGIYKKSTTGAITNCPTEEKAYMEVNKFCDVNETIQKIYTITGTPTVYIRTRTNGTLGSWYKFEGTVVN